MKKFEQQQEHGSKFFGGGQDPPGYAPDPSTWLNNKIL